DIPASLSRRGIDANRRRPAVHGYQRHPLERSSVALCLSHKRRHRCIPEVRIRAGWTFQRICVHLHPRPTLRDWPTQRQVCEAIRRTGLRFREGDLLHLWGTLREDDRGTKGKGEPSRGTICGLGHREEGTEVSSVHECTKSEEGEPDSTQGEQIVFPRYSVWSRRVARRARAQCSV